MSYKALYRIYRPQTFDEVVGQKHIVQTLKNAIKEDKIAHAYLFAGPKGTGKTTIAKLLAKAVNCTSETLDHPCGECDSCKAISEGTHPDIIEIDAASNNKIDEARDIIEKVKFSPIQGKYKVYIIDEVHMMTAGAFNTLLKTLEEPPAHVIFILATTEAHKVLPTIVSRCQRFDFNKISQADLEKRIKEILEKENVKYEDEAVRLIAELADGGARDAISTLDQAIAYAGNELKAQHVRDIYGVVSTKEAVDFLLAISNEQADRALEKINDFTRRGLDLNRFAHTLINLLKETIVFNNAVKYEGIVETQYLKEMSQYIGTKTAFQYVDILMDTLTNFYKVAIPKTFFELAILKMCNVDKQAQPEVKVVKEVVKEVVKPVEEKPVEVKPTEPEIKVEEPKVEEVIEEPAQETIEIKEEQPQTVSPLAKEGIRSYQEMDLMNVLQQANIEDLNDLKERWRLLKQYMQNPQYSKAVSLLIDGMPLAAAHTGIVIGYLDKPQLNIVNKESNYRIIKEFLKELIGREVAIYTTTDSDFKIYRLKFVNYRNLKKLPPQTPIADPMLLEVEEPKVEVAKSEEQTEIDEAKEYGTTLFGSLFESEA